MSSAVVEKLQKLISHEKSARGIGSVAEAEAFAAKIAELLFANKLSMSEIEVADEERNEPVNQESVGGFTAPWAGTLIMGVAKASFCEVVNSRKDYYLMIGRTFDRQAAIALYNYLVALAVQLAEAGLKEYKASDRYEADRYLRPGIVKTWKVSFLKGYANALYYRLEKQVVKLTADATSAGSSLVFVDKSKAAIADFKQATYGKLSKGRSTRSRIHGDAYAQGQAAGSSVSLGGQQRLNA